MARSAVVGSAELKERELVLTNELAGCEQQLKPLCEALLKRSEVRSLLGDCDGALEDAERARALCPARQECLVRVTQALLDAGRPGMAFEAFQRAQAAPDADANILDALNRKLRPFEHLPDELVALIFGFVMQDFERLRTPFQVAHVCKRWRSIANSTPALWRDLRILRVSKRAIAKHSGYFPPLRKAFTASKGPRPNGLRYGREDGNHLELLALCASRCRSTFTHFELEVSDFGEAPDLISKHLLAHAGAARATLRSVSFVHTNIEERGRFSHEFDDDDESHASPFATLCLEIVLRCPNLVDVELSLGEILQGGTSLWQLSTEALSAPPTPSFRRLKLDGFDGFTNTQGPAARELLLQRAAHLRSLVLDNIPNYDLQSMDQDRIPFALQLLANCATTLVDLEISGQANVLRGMKTIGTLSFPALRHFKYVVHTPRLQMDIPGLMDGMTFPKLDTLEAPADIIANFPLVPAHIILRLDLPQDAAGACKIFAEWLGTLDGDQSPQLITVLVTHEIIKFAHMSLLHGIIDALTPSRAKKVSCRRLTRLVIRFRSGLRCFRTNICPTPDHVALRRPDWAEEWDHFTNVSRVADMEHERRVIALGVEAADKTTAAGTTTAAGCEALSSIELEGCRISKDAWAKLKASPCDVRASPSPEDMARLPWKSKTGLKRKQEKDGEAQAS